MKQNRSRAIAATRSQTAAFLRVGLAALMLLTALLFAQLAYARSAPASFADLAERLSPAVVNISTSQTVERPGFTPNVPELPPGSPFEDFFKDFFDRRGGDDPSPRKVQSLGSGFVVDPQGYIVTNNHVIENADEISINFADGSSADAELVGTDPKTDIALLKLKETPEAPIDFVTFGDSDRSRVGDWVIAIGNPFGLGGSVSAGIISARNRDISSGPYDDFIQTDAAINRGNSGGPLFNMDGEVIGVNTAIFSPTGGSVGVGFSVPAKIAGSVVDQLREFGETRRGWIGVRIRKVTDELAEGLGLEEPKGALVEDVTADGPAEAAGVEIGDVIISFDGNEIENMRSLPRAVAETTVDETVRMVVIRKGKSKTLKVTVGRLTEDGKPVKTALADAEDEEAVSQREVLGMKLTAMDRDLRETFKLPQDQKGVLISDVESTSAAAKKGLRRGDVIVEVAQEAVDSPDMVIDRIEAERAAGKSSVLLLVSRQDDVRFVALRFAPED